MTPNGKKNILNFHFNDWNPSLSLKETAKKKSQTQGWLQQQSDSDFFEHPVGKFKQYLKQSGVVLVLRFIIAVACSLWLDCWSIAWKWRNDNILHSGKNGSVLFQNFKPNCKDSLRKLQHWTSKKEKRKMVENDWRIHFFAETAHWSDNTLLLQRQSPSEKLINNVFHLLKIIYNYLNNLAWGT